MRNLGNLGIVRVDELLMPIVEVSLVRGGLQIVAEARGPCSAAAGPARLFSPQGEPVTELAWGEASYIEIPYVPPGQTAVLTWMLNFTRFVSRPVERQV